MYLGFFIYIILVIFFGAGGITDYTSLLHYYETLKVNIEDLNSINQKLYEKLTSFNSNPETIRIYSRELSYFRPDERVIKFQGFSPMKIFYKVGTLLKRNKLEKNQNYIFILVGMIVFIFSFVATTFLKTRQLNGNKKK